MIRIAVYGKGGIGKSTTVSNMAAALADQGRTVMLIGCDPKSDSTLTLRGDQELKSILDVYREKNSDIELEDMYIRGYKDIICIETGGPTPGLGCAGRGVMKALELLKQKGAEEKLKPDVVFYDVLGDVVCGGFSMPIRKGYADKIYVVTSGEKMAVHAAMNLSLAIDNLRRSGSKGLTGIILNSRQVPGELAKVQQLSEDVNAPIAGILDFSKTVQNAEEKNKTVIEAFPDSIMAQEYTKLAAEVTSAQKEEIC